ncbi:glycosyltransferase [Aureisphaera galaxeae]|uniref:glycosyltransferase n=1 Tax=Aureisphaera galaxeae TaxID=1538023 RepID=UPI0023502235|nr:glycosyltransferase [Aureisphaera galaxeae]MDC8005464.1 glycosyltransferase [Aureisphaera galaxeae]
MSKKLLIIGHTFPEPTTTAAGSRMLQLVGLFKEEGYEITFASTASRTQQTAIFKDEGIEEVSIRLNDISFDEFVFQLNPSVVLFDRYMTEEKFGWRVAEQCPNALRILDTEDLHFLRRAREEALKKDAPINLHSDTAKRELASILRCDLSLIISEYEMQLLTETFHIPEGILYYVPFLLDPVSEETKRGLPNFDQRKGFMTIGNLMHAPNVDSVKYLKNEVWPAIRKQLPNAELSVYGNYAPKHITEMHNPKEGFHIKGWAKDVDAVMNKARVCLAPLRFGAGLKGKLVDAMRCGTPSVTTNVGAEGISGEFPFGGMISDNLTDFVTHAVQLYLEEDIWLEKQENGFKILCKRFQKDRFSEAFMNMVRILQNNMEEHREEHFLGQVILHHSLQSTKYMSKWIEAKNRGRHFRREED